VQVETDGLKLGTPTILINNAAIVNGKPLMDLSFEDIERNFRVNLLSHFYTLKTFLPSMVRAGQGTVVTMSSVLGKTGAAHLTDYAAAKAAVTAMHRSLVAELKSIPDIKTILVSPGQLSTPLFNGVETPSSFFGPVLEPVDVAKEVIAAIDSGSSTNLAMPFYSRWIDWMNVLPVGVEAILRRITGIDNAMNTFVGRQEGLGEKEPLNI
jgi:NAD(P)-dependent dehydrogenase (short-subunit alcohol dehydrogenase family)